MKNEKTAIQKFTALQADLTAARKTAAAENQLLLGLQRTSNEGMSMPEIQTHFQHMTAAMERAGDAAIEVERLTRSVDQAQHAAHAETLANFHSCQPELENEKNATFIKFRAAVDALLEAEKTYSTAHEAARANVVAYRHYCHEHGLAVDPLLQMNSLFHYEAAVYRQLEPVFSRVTGRQQQINGNPHSKILGGIFTAKTVPELEEAGV